MNEYINLTLENIDEEHICCAIGVLMFGEDLGDAINEMLSMVNVKPY